MNKQTNSRIRPINRENKLIVVREKEGDGQNGRKGVGDTGF